eukprot:TRINITY_DN16384_c0_g1_i1.p1 TRINITY_DN16384_c0_g1~~TRINITY_DN16384_c0_g1_i1.p1  ORF type:complete len:396 (+),score=94.91 TRINITY_DN16384_c0_g1_i1:76-1188(+)
MGLSKDASSSESFLREQRQFAETQKALDAMCKLNKEAAKAHKEAHTHADRLVAGWRDLMGPPATNGAAGEAIAKSAETVQKLEALQQRLAERVGQVYSGPLETFRDTEVADLAAYERKLKEVRLEYEAALKRLKQAKEPRSGPQLSAPISVEQAEKEAEEKRQIFLTMETEVEAEMVKIQARKQMTLLKAVTDYLTAQQEHHLQCMNAISEIVPFLDQTQRQLLTQLQQERELSSSHLAAAYSSAFPAGMAPSTPTPPTTGAGTTLDPLPGSPPLARVATGAGAPGPHLFQPSNSFAVLSAAVATFESSGEKEAKTGTALFSYDAQAEGQLSLKQGEEITHIFAASEAGWSIGRKAGKTGLFPTSYVAIQ